MRPRNPVNILRNWHERRQAMHTIRALQQREDDSLEYDDNNLLRQAKVAISLGAVDEAARKWDQARALYPSYVRKSHDSIAVLLGLKRFDEAEGLMTEAKRLFPRDSHYLASLARVAQSRGAYKMANERWTEYRRRFPRDGMGFVESAVCLREAGMPDDAESLITRSVELISDSIVCRIEWARIAEARLDWQEALQRWNWIEQKLHHVSGVVGAVRALTALGKDDEAMNRLSVCENEYGRDPDFCFILDHLRRSEREPPTVK
jgi:tetratricopeptide (TPR) repeat protein